MKKSEDCRHETIYWGSGDYYLFCRGCGLTWAMITPDHQVAPQLSNLGPGAMNSGVDMVMNEPNSEPSSPPTHTQP